MKKTSDRVEAARKLVGPVAEDFVQAAADRVAPLAEAAATAWGTATDRVSPYAQTAVDRVGPWPGQARDLVTPYAQQAAAAVSPYAAAAVGAVTPLALQAAGKLGPLADTAMTRGNQAARDAVERLGPILDDAIDRVGPAVDSARERVSSELMPKVTGALAAAAGTPIVAEALSRGQATLAAARGELTLPPPQSKRKWPKRVAVVAAAVAAAYLVTRKLLGSKDTDWQAARPTTPYAPPKPATPDTATAENPSIFATDEAPAEETPSTPSVSEEPTLASSPAEEVTDGPSEAEDDQQAGLSAHSEYLEANGEAEPEQPAEGGVAESEAEVDTVVSATSFAEADTLATDPELDSDPTVLVEPDNTVVMESVPDFADTADTADMAETADTTETGVPVAADAGESGSGVYRGSEPPEGFVIKGNERSMKYHLPDSDSYVRTIAEVWFDSEAAAQAAGFEPAHS